MSILHLWRYAIKGLDCDKLPSMSLVPGGGFPNDHRWAMHFDDDGHHSNYLCACTAPVLLGRFEMLYSDAGDILVVRRRKDGAELLVARLPDDAD